MENEKETARKLQEIADKLLTELMKIQDIEERNIDCIYELRQEAIKWIKELDNQLSKKELEGLKDFQEKVIGITATVEWIKCFFNITEEDLK